MKKPLNNGDTFQTDRGPRPEYCPMASSRKNSGMPQRIRHVKYGIKKAPGMIFSN